jgi:rubredoxin
VPKYEINYDWTCPQCGTFNFRSYHCKKCFYEPKTPKQRMSVVAVGLGTGCGLLVIIGGLLVLGGSPATGAVFIVIGALMGFAASKW